MAYVALLMIGFSSYINERYQSVVYNGCESEHKYIRCGVPQGSILGPLLFLIHINDLPFVTNLFMPILFADDNNLFCTGRNIDLLVNEINDEISKVYSWVKANKLSLNIDKTNFMLFTPKCFSSTMGNILIDGHPISEVWETKFLEVIIENNLTWSAHIQYTGRNISKGIGVMAKARKVFEQNTLLSFYNSLILPYLNYCIHVWGKAYNTHLNHLITMQNKAVRLIAGATCTQHKYCHIVFRVEYHAFEIILHVCHWFIHVQI